MPIPPFPRLRVEEADGSPTGQPSTLKFEGCTVSYSGNVATVTPAGGGGGVGGTVGATDNRIPRSDGTGGATLQAGLTTEDDSGNVTTTGHLTPGKRLKGKQGTDVASETDITLGDGNYFHITGTTAINTIAAAGWPSGSLVVLQFTASVTVAHAGAGDFDSILLAGAANFSATAGDTLTLIYDGANGVWRECARAVI